MTDDCSSLTVTHGDRVARLTMSRPAKLNELNDGVRRALATALHDLTERPDIAVVVIAGDGRAFSAGADLTTTAYPPVTGDSGDAPPPHRHVAACARTARPHPQATVARLHGHVVGGAALLAAACDIRIVADDTAVRIPELAIGIPLTWAGIPLLVREVGLPHARDWVMTGRRVGAEELLRTGFAQRVVARDDLDRAVDERAGTCRRCARTSGDDPGDDLGDRPYGPGDGRRVGRRRPPALGVHRAGVPRRRPPT